MAEDGFTSGYPRTFCTPRRGSCPTRGLTPAPATYRRTIPTSAIIKVQPLLGNESPRSVSKPHHQQHTISTASTSTTASSLGRLSRLLEIPRALKAWSGGCAYHLAASQPEPRPREGGAYEGGADTASLAESEDGSRLQRWGLRGWQERKGCGRDSV